MISSMITVILFVAAVWDTAHGSWYPIGADPLSKTDLAARSEVLIQIAAKLEEIVESQNTAIATCEASINQTIDECNACRANLCQPKPPLEQQILLTVVTGANKAVIAVSKVTDDAGKWFQKAGSQLGNRAGDFANTLGKTADSVGNVLGGAGLFVLNGLGDGFKDLGTKFKTAGVTLNNAVLKPSLNGLNIGFNSINKELGKALSGLDTAFSSAGDFFKGVGGGISDIFRNLGRKKRFVIALVRNRRCVNSCPVCDKLDTKKHTESQILENVCGTTFATNQDQAMKDIQWLEVSFNNTRDNTLVVKVEFDSSTFDFVTQTAESAKYQASATTLSTSANKQNAFPKPPKFNLGDNDQNGKSIGADYFTKAWNRKIQN